MDAIVIMDSARRDDGARVKADTDAVNMIAGRHGLNLDQVFWARSGDLCDEMFRGAIKCAEMSGTPVILADDRVLSVNQLQALDEAGLPVLIARKTGVLQGAVRPAPERLGVGPYDLVIGLGQTCSTAYRLRKHLGLKRSYPFDWMGTPPTSLPGVLRARLKLEFTPENIGEWEGFARNRKFLVSHNHDFPHGPDGRPVIDRAHMQKASQRLDYLAARFFRDCKQARNIAFVLSDPSDRSYFGTTSPPLVYEDIFTALEEVSGGQWKLFVVTSMEYFAPPEGDPRVQWIRFTDHGDPDDGEEWTGSERGWKDALAEIFGADALIC